MIVRALPPDAEISDRDLAKLISERTPQLVADEIAATEHWIKRRVNRSAWKQITADQRLRRLKTLVPAVLVDPHSGEFRIVGAFDLLDPVDGPYLVNALADGLFESGIGADAIADRINTLVDFAEVVCRDYVLEGGINLRDRYGDKVNPVSRGEFTRPRRISIPPLPAFDQQLRAVKVLHEHASAHPKTLNVRGRNNTMVLLPLGYGARPTVDGQHLNVGAQLFDRRKGRIDLSQGLVIKSGKWPYRSRTVQAAHELFRLELEWYLNEVRPRFALDPFTGPFFPRLDRRGHALGRGTRHALLAGIEVLTNAGIVVGPWEDTTPGGDVRFNKGFPPHALRKAWATAHLLRHRDLLRLRDEGGWTSFTAIEHYLGVEFIEKTLYGSSRRTRRAA